MILKRTFSQYFRGLVSFFSLVGLFLLAPLPVLGASITPSSSTLLSVPAAKAGTPEKEGAKSSAEGQAAGTGKVTPQKSAVGNSAGTQKQSPGATPKMVKVQAKKKTASKKTVGTTAAASASTASKSAAGKNGAVAPAAKKAEDKALKNFPIANVPLLQEGATTKQQVHPTWEPLMQRLLKDGVDKDYLRGMFLRLGDSYSHVPMGTKINELFTLKYMPRPQRKSSTSTKTSSPPVYKSMVTTEVIERCRLYIGMHEMAFKNMELQYGVPKEVVAGLIMVETRLGNFLGSSSSFWSLACLAAADSPERVKGTVEKFPLPMTPDKEIWLKKILQERSQWAYGELLALVRYSQEAGLDPLLMPGSVYGAVGLCQFMPSNISKFGVDGNKDGKINLFDPEDAIPSVANYLQKHGWAGGDRTVHHAALKRYNKSNVYANTILAIADGLDPKAQALAEKSKGKDSTKAAGSGTKKAQGSGKSTAKSTTQGTANKTKKSVTKSTKTSAVKGVGQATAELGECS